MIFTETPLAGAFLIDLERREDERGFFARTWCRREFASHGLDPCVVQASIAQNGRRGTVRGMHYQAPPHEETKVVRCPRGAVYDVIVDLRPDSPSYGRWFGAELSAANGRALYIPAGCAHGYQTLEDDTEVAYQMSAFYAPGFDRGLRHDDPALGIAWPLPVSLIAPKDQAWPPFAAQTSGRLA